MTNTDTVDVLKTAIQCAELARAGSELVRITVNTPEAAAAVPKIRAHLDSMGVGVPLIGDFHYNGHRLLADYPRVREGARQVPINPGNVGHGKKRDEQFAQMIETLRVTANRYASASIGGASIRTCWRGSWTKTPDAHNRWMPLA